MKEHAGRSWRGARAIVTILVAAAVVLSGGATATAADAGPARAAVSSPAGAPKLGIPLVLGAAHVGARVSAEHGLAPLRVYQHRAGGVPYQTPVADYSYQWFANKKPIAGQTGAALRIGRTLAGKHLSFRVTARTPDGQSASAMSLETPKVSTPGLVRMVELPFDGYRGNSRFALEASGWPAGTKLRYQWTIDNRPAAKGTGRTYELLPRVHNYLDLAAVVTVQRAGYETLMLHVPMYGRAGLLNGQVWNEVRPNIVSVRGEGTPRGQAVGSLEGVVQSPTGRAMAGATVEVKRTGRGSAYTTPVLVKKAKTDADGHVRIGGLTPGNYCLTATGVPGYAQGHPQCLTIDTGTTARVYAGSTSTFALDMSKTSNIVGKVTDSRGKAVKYARVYAYTLDATAKGYHQFRMVRAVKADAQGNYRFTGLARNSYVLRAGGSSSLTHKGDWWRSVHANYTFNAIHLDSSQTARRNFTLQAYLPMGTPTIAGKARVGSTLTATHGRTSGARYAYEWRADGKAISGAKSSKLVVTRALIGKRITVLVAGTRTGYAKTKRVSAATAKIPR